MADKYLIVGLGNPGRDYEQTRHNVGFMVVDELARRAGIGLTKKERKALVGDGTLAGKSVILAKPQTYMNLSGEAVRALLDFYQIPVERFIVVHDDIDLPLGTLRLRKSGSAGGQNGVRSLIQHLGTQDFARVRFGVGRPPGKQQAAHYVLRPFQGEEAILAREVIDTAAAAIEAWLKDGLEIAMSVYNGDIAAKAAQPAPEEELQISRRAHELAPHDPKPLEQMARLYKKLRQLDEAVQTHLQLAALYERQGNIRPMLLELENVAAIRPERIELQERLARLHEQHDNPRAAVNRWLKLADYHEAQGNPAAALRAVQEALRLNPVHPKAQTLEKALREKMV